MTHQFDFKLSGNYYQRLSFEIRMKFLIKKKKKKVPYFFLENPSENLWGNFTRKLSEWARYSFVVAIENIDHDRGLKLSLKHPTLLRFVVE